MNEADRKLVESVVTQGYLTREQVDALLAAQKGSTKPVSDLLIEAGVLSRDTVEVMVRTAPAPRPTPAPKQNAPDPPEVARAAADPKMHVGKYVLVQELGRGGMGAVYRAWQPDLKRFVAIKVLTADDPTAIERFHREAMMASQIRHPGIVAVHEYGDHEGRPFIVMDLLAGEPLDRVMRRRRLTTRQAVEVIAAAAHALAAAHKKGIIHRDVKPSNMLVELGGSEAPRVALTDFGLAKPVNLKERLTQAGMILGTPHYMSPEQARGAKLDARSDVYSLGAVLYELLTARPVVDGKQVYEMLNRIISVEPVAPRKLDPRLPVDLETVVLKCLDKSTDRRYRDAGALAEDLNAFLEHRAVSALPVGGLTKSVRWVKGRPWVMAAAGGLLAAAIALTMFVALKSARADAEGLRGELDGLMARLRTAKSAEERAAVEKEIERTRAKIDSRAPEAPPPRRDEAAAKRFDAVRSQVVGAPSAFSANLKAIDGFLADFAASPEADGARRLRADVEAMRTSESAKALLAIESALAAHCRERRFGAALKLLALPAELEGAARLKELQSQVERKAYDAWQALLQRADGLAPEEARRVLEEARDFEIPEYAQRASDAIAALRAAPPPDVTPVEPGLDLRALAAALASEDLATAKALTAKDEATAKIVAGLDELGPRALAGFARRAGEKATLALANGEPVKVELLGVKGEAVLARVIEYKAETTYRLKDLAFAEIAAAAQLGGLDRAALAIAVVIWGDRTKADAPPEVAALVEAIAAERLERSAVAEVEALRKAKDEKKAREILARLDGEMSATRAVTAAREEIEQIRVSLDLKGIDVLALLHAGVKRAAGAETHLEYGFASDAEVADCLIEQVMIGNQEAEGTEAHRGPDGLKLINTRVAVGPAWRGAVELELRCSTELVQAGSLLVNLDPFLIAWNPGAGWFNVVDRRVRGPLGTAQFTRAAEAVLRIVIRAKQIEVSCGGQSRTAAVEPVDDALQLRLQVGGNGKAVVKRAVLEGVVDAAWARRIAGEKKEPRPGPTTALLNGRTLAGWRLDFQDRGRVEGGALRLDAAGSGDRDGATAMSEKRYRNGRLTFEYRLERGRYARCALRNGYDAIIEMWLPWSEGSGWRKVELMAVEERVVATVDGMPYRAESRTGTTVTGPTSFHARLSTSALFREIKWQPIDPPPGGRWMDLCNATLDGWKVLSGADRWGFDKGLLTLDGPVTMRSLLPFETADVAFRVRLSEGGEGVISFRYNGPNVGMDLAIPADGRPHEVTATLKGDELRVSLDGKPANLRPRGQQGQPFDGNLFIDAVRGKMEVTGLKARQ